MIFAVILGVIFFFVFLGQSVQIGWFFVAMLLVTFVMYTWRGGFQKLIDNPYRFIEILAVQVLIYSVGSILIPAKDSLLAGSFLAAIILFGTYLYIRREAKRIQNEQ